MNGKLAKLLRRQAEEETAGKYHKARVIAADDKGTYQLVSDCTRGRYRELKRFAMRGPALPISKSASATVQAILEARRLKEHERKTGLTPYKKPAKKAPYKRRNLNAIRETPQPTSKP